MQGTLFELHSSTDAISEREGSTDEELALNDIGQQIMSFDLNTMQPIEALNILHSMHLKLHDSKNQSYERADL